MEWKKDGSSVKDEGRFVILKGDMEPGLNSLIIEDVQLDDAGEYQCIAKSDAGEVTTTAILKVHEKLNPPEFVDSPESIPMEITEGGDVKLEAVIAGKPYPEIKWFREDKPLEDSKHYKFVDDGDVHSLIIVGVSPDDSGTFKCEAANDAGKVYRTYEVKIEGKVWIVLLQIIL